MITSEEQMEVTWHSSISGLDAWPGPGPPNTSTSQDSSSWQNDFAGMADPALPMFGGSEGEGEEELAAASPLAFEQVANCPERPSTSSISTILSTSPPKPRHQACLGCEEKFNTGDELELHAIMNRHHTFVCPDPGCAKIYCRRDACTRHAATHDGSDARKHRCWICRADFARKDHLTRHMRVQHPSEGLRPSAKSARKAASAGIDIKKVKESEPALRRELSRENLAIKMLDIANKCQSAEEGAQKAFACVVAHAALNSPRPLTPRTKRRLETVVKPSEIKPPDLEVLKTLEVS